MSSTDRDESTASLPLPSAPTTVAPLPGFDEPERQPWPVGFRFLDDFEVEGVLGQGGMGTVYRVRQDPAGQRLADAVTRRRFLAELQLWIELPAHPHLAPCRFFRTVADEVVVFTDLADAGTVGDAITAGRLDALAGRLDVAIQAAWGLHALHERGLVHQDVKPANVLLWADGTARVADFGVARARARRAPAAAGQTTLVTAGLLTPAYCSPEQASGQPVSRRTDIWSWGVLVLEMFVGKVPCCDRGGPLARAVFTRHVREPRTGLALPADVAEALDLCLREPAEERWSSLADAAAELARLYKVHTGRDYPRPTPASVALDTDGPATLDRRRVWSGQWEPPRKWLALAFEAAGRDPTEADALLPPPAGSRRAQAVADLSAYEDARLLLDRLVREGRDDLLPRQAALYAQKALVHLAVADGPAAQELFERAIALWEELVRNRGRRELTPWLIRACLHRAQSLRVLGEHAAAEELCGRVVALWERLDNRKRRRELHDDLAQAWLIRGLVLRDRGRRTQALECLDRAIALWEPAVEQGDTESGNDLAHAYLARAGILGSDGPCPEALRLCDQAIGLRRRLTQREGRRDLEGDLARAYLIKANVLRSQGRAADSVPLFEQAIGLYERLVEEAGRDDLVVDLAWAYVALGRSLRVLGEPARAAGLCERGTALLEHLVRTEGRTELRHELARTYLQHAQAERLGGDAGRALSLAEQAVALWRHLVEADGRADLEGDLARGLAAKAAALQRLGQLRQALALTTEALELRERLYARTGRDDLPAELARDRVTRAELLADLDRPAEAREGLAEAVATLEGFPGRVDLRGVLDRSRRLLARLRGAEEPRRKG